MIELKLTPENNHYWNNNGAYTQEMDRLYKKFVPMYGRSKNLTGEVIRAANRLYYEFCNNGNGNALNIISEWVECVYCGGSGLIDVYDDEEFCAEECPDCNGEGGYYDDKFTLNWYYNNFVKLIRYYFEQKDCKEGIEAIDEVLRVIENNADTTEYNMCKYDRCMDYVIWCVLNDEDNQESIPEWYTND
jgi:hypothetical protein